MYTVHMFFLSILSPCLMLECILTRSPITLRPSTAWAAMAPANRPPVKPQVRMSCRWRHFNCSYVVIDIVCEDDRMT